jgi:hypothetical protein
MKAFTTVLMLFVAMMAWGQDSDETLSDQDGGEEIKAIERQWASKPLQVSPTSQRAGIWDFARAFCREYSHYRPNVCLTDYLKQPGDYSWEEKHYYVDDAPRNGYIKCDMAWQFDYETEMCYWRRTDGHSLVGVLLQMGHEGEGTANDYALLFYDYDPSTRTMTPDTQVYRTVKSLVRRHQGNPSFRMPKEDKNISVTYVQWHAEDDFDFEEHPLQWTGNTFK